MNSTIDLPLDPRTDSPFGFIPTLWVCVMFIALFSITTAVHLFQTFKFRPIWWWLPTLVACGLIEVIGWSGRLWGSQNPWSMNPYLMQICCTIFAPSFMTAAMFIIFVRIIVLVGPEYSRLSPKLYSWLFVGVDLVALVIQSVGGAHASMANTPQGSEDGAHIMVGGIILQMAAVTVYALTSIEYFWRVYAEKPLRPPHVVAPVATLATLPDASNPRRGLNVAGEKSEGSSVSATITGRARLTKNLKLMVLGLAIATVLVIVRSIYRTIELLDGWGGPIITNQTLFDCLDGVPIFLAMVTFNIFHPGYYLPNPRRSNLATTPSIA